MFLSPKHFWSKTFGAPKVTDTNERGQVNVVEYAVPNFAPLLATQNIFLPEQLNQWTGAVLQASVIPPLIAAIPSPMLQLHLAMVQVISTFPSSFTCGFHWQGWPL